MKRYFLLVLICCTGFFAKAQNNTGNTTFSFSVDQAIDYALKNTSTMQNALLDEQLNKRKVQEFLGQGYPQVSASGSGQDYLNIPTTYFPDFLSPIIYGDLYSEKLISSVPAPSGVVLPVQFGLKYSLNGSINASQLIFDGQFFVGVQAQKALFALTQKSTQRSKIETSVAVEKTYYNALIADKRLQLLNTNVDQIKKLEDDTKAYYQNGLVEKLDVDRITVTYNNLLLEKENVVKLTQLSKMLLKFQMGMDVNATLILTDSLRDNDFESILQQGTFDPQNRIEYQLLQSQDALYGLQKKLNQFAFLPGLYAQGSYGYSGESNTFNFFDKPQTIEIDGEETEIKHWYPSTYVGLQLSIPIFDGFQKTRRVQQATINMMETENNMANLRNAINLEVSQAKIELSNSNASLKGQRDNMELAKQVYNTTKIKYDQGVGSSLELVNASAGYKEAETNYLNALYDAWIAKIDYEKAIGQFK
jgi:outer membrane protein